MKMQSKLLLVSLTPLLTIGVLVCILSGIKINTVVTGTIENGLKGVATAVRDTLWNTDKNSDYRLTEDGELYKGDFYVSGGITIVDNIKRATGMEVIIFYKDTCILTSVVDANGKRIVGTQAADNIVLEVLRKKGDYFSTKDEILGQKYFGYYIPLNDRNMNPIGMVFAGVPQADAKAQIMKIVGVILAIIISMTILAAILLFFIVRRLVRALHKGTNALEEVSLDENTLKRKDEVGKISRAIIKLREELVSIIGTMKQHSDELAASAEYLDQKMAETTDTLSQVEKAVSEVSDSATSQASETQNATRNVIEIGDMVADTAKEAETMYANAQNMSKLGNEAFETLHELQDINAHAKESIDAIYEQTNNTNDSVHKIREATSLITSIAEETNLLSLNASIEAARAGAQGRGFAVVAAQIQKLAEQTNESARHIEDIIASLLADSESAVQTMDVVKENMEKQTENVIRTDERFEEVLKGIAESLQAINRITVKTEEMDKARVSVVDTVQSLSAIAEENAASTQESSASITEISASISNIAEKAGERKDIANQMEERMQVFKLNGDEEEAADTAAEDETVKETDAGSDTAENDGSDE